MRYIDLTITNEYIKGTGEFVGAAGSHDDVAFRMTFGPMWLGLTKTVLFHNAYRQNPTIVVVTAAMLEDPSVPNVYVVPIPVEAKQYAGKMGLTIKGATVEDDTETSATLSVYGEFIVKESYWDNDAEAAADVTASQAEQLQSQIEELTDDMLDAIATASSLQTSWDNLAVEAESLSADEEASVEKTQTQSSLKFTFGIPRGHDGVVTETDGVFFFVINAAGHLILTCIDDDDVDFSIDETGHLIVSFEV